MSRRLTIGILIFLILGIIGGTIALVIRRLQPIPSTEIASSSTSPGLVVNPLGDSDGDGLSNSDELKWGTNPSLMDTDGDGFKDGEEVVAHHNPTIAGPDDKLPEGFQPGKNENEEHALTIADIIDLTTPTPLPADLQPSTAPLAVDQYFEANLDLSGGSANLTELYYKQYNTTSITSSVVPFVQNQQIITKLPTTYESLIKTASSESSTSIAEYIAQASYREVLSNRISLLSALSDLFQNNSATRLDERISATEEYQKRLLDISVPPTAKPLHRLLVGYSELVRATLKQINLWNTDKVKALVGIKQLDAIDRLYYPLIESELSRLDKL